MVNDLIHERIREHIKLGSKALELPMKWTDIEWECVKEFAKSCRLSITERDGHHIFTGLKHVIIP